MSQSRDNLIHHLEKKIERRQRARLAKKSLMKVSGQNVLHLKNIIINKSSKIKET